MKVSSCVLDWRGGTRDFSRNHHSLTEHNTIPVRGVNGEARDFNGVDAYIDCGNHSSLNITDVISVEAWVKPNNVTDILNIVAKNYQDTHPANYIFRIKNGYVGFRAYNGGWLGLYDDTTLLSTNTWYHLAATYNRQYVRLYVDGIEVKNVSLMTVMLNNSHSVTIGCNGNGFAQFFNGTISSARIYNRALTPLEIWNNYVTMKPYVPLSESPVAIV